MTRHQQRDESLEWVLPLEVSGPIDFTLIGIWAMNHRSSTPLEPSAPRQPLAAADTYNFDKLRGRVVVAGDFNSNPNWDSTRHPRFARLVERYRQDGLTSAYHHGSDEAHGAETKPTLWWRNRIKDGPKFHVDYIFLPDSWLSASAVEIGGYDEWVSTAGSDHAPIIVDINIEHLRHVERTSVGQEGTEQAAQNDADDDGPRRARSAHPRFWHSRARSACPLWSSARPVA